MKVWYLLLMLPILFAMEFPNVTSALGNQSWEEKFSSNHTTILNNTLYDIRIDAPSNVKVNYTLENDTLTLFFEVWKGNPCQYLEAEVKEMSCINCYEILLSLKQKGEYCIQVVPETPATASVNLQLNPEVRDVYIKVTYRGVYSGEDCTQLRIKLQEALRKGNITEAERIIVQLRKMCGINVNLTEEMEELNETINETFQILGEWGKEIREEIRSISNEIKNATNQTQMQIQERIRNVTRKIEEMGEINASDLGEKIKVMAGKIIVEGLNLTPEKKIRIRVKNLEVEVEKNTYRIRAGDIDIDVKTEIEIVNNTIRTRTGVVRVDPQDIQQELKMKIENVVLKDEEKPVYEIEGEKEGKLLWIIPVKMKVEAKVNAENGEFISLKKPWWSFLVFG